MGPLTHVVAHFTISIAVTRLQTGQPKILSAGAKGISPERPEGLWGPTSQPLKGAEGSVQSFPWSEAAVARGIFATVEYQGEE